MPAMHATGTAGILASYELDRDLAALQGTYGWFVQSGAVTFSASLTFNVAAVAVGDIVVNGVVGTAAYAGGTVVLAAQDATNPRVDVIVITSGGAVSAITGVPKALTTTSGPVPTAPTASQLEIARIYVPASGTALTSASITDRRAQTPGPIFLAGSSTAVTATTSTSAVDLVTISALGIPVAMPFRIEWNVRKTATNAQVVSTGVKINATVVYEAVTGAPYQSSATQQAEDGFAVMKFWPRSSTNYLNGVSGYGGWRVSASGANSATTAFMGGLTAGVPNAVVTSIAIRAINGTSNNNCEVTSIRILSGLD